MIHFIRVLFLLLVATVALTYTQKTSADVLKADANVATWLVMVGSVVVAFAILTLDLVVKRKNLTALSGLFFGLLVGVLVSLCLSYLLEEIAQLLLFKTPPPAPPATTGPADSYLAREIEQFQSVKLYNDNIRSLLQGIELLLGLMVTYITVSFILQTKDDFRFIVPYVEFSRVTKGPRPLLLDTSVIIDGRIADVAATGIFESRLVVPRFVLTELQTVADSGDRLKRSRGRRGLDVLQKLQANPKLELHIWDGSLQNVPETEGVDQKLVALAQQEHGRVVTNDFNLLKIAQLRGVDVVNINSIADALKPVVLPGESMRVRVVKPGESPGQGVGYLEDGTMVVVEGARERIGSEVDIIVTNALQTAAGKMIFGRTESHATPSPTAAAAIPPGLRSPRRPDGPAPNDGPAHG